MPLTLLSMHVCVPVMQTEVDLCCRHCVSAVTSMCNFVVLYRTNPKKAHNATAIIHHVKGKAGRGGLITWDSKLEYIIVLTLVNTIQIFFLDRSEKKKCSRFFPLASVKVKVRSLS